MNDDTTRYEEMRAAFGDVAIYERPSFYSNQVGVIDEGTIITVYAGSRRIAAGQVWVKHERGWSAERRADESAVFLIRSELCAFYVPGETHPIPDVSPDAIEETEIPIVVEAEPPPSNYLQVLTRLRTRVEPLLSAERLNDKILDVGTVIEIDPESRVEADGYIWVKHAGGWSAERAIDGSAIFLKGLDSAEDVEDEAETGERLEGKADVSKPPVVTVEEGDKLLDNRLQATARLRVRPEPSIEVAPLPDRTLDYGEIVEIDPASRVEAGDYIWVKHQYGWSVERAVDDEEYFLVRPTKEIVNPGAPDPVYMPSYKSLIRRLPVDIDQTDLFQYFGNNVFAFTDGKNFNYDGYAQGLHGGLDFMNTRPEIPVYAGVEATYLGVRRHSPNLSVWLEAGKYTLIYQHITNPRPFNPGDRITPDTIIAEIEPLPWYHLHFEVRYRRDWIINPLLLMSDELVAQITEKFDPQAMSYGVSRRRYFYKSESWRKWIAPLDQPVIRLAGGLIGPRAQ